MAEATTPTFRVGPDTYTVKSYVASGGVAKLPAVVLVHGTEGLDGESGTEIPKLANQIADGGFVVFVPEYFGSKEPAGVPVDVLFMTRIQSVRTYAPRIAAAVDHARADPRAAGGGVGLVGLSLGGGLALQYAVGAPPGTVDAVVDFFGYIDAGSSVYRDAGKLPPTFIFHTENDKVVDVSYSLNLRDALKKDGVTHEYHPNDDDYRERKFHAFRPGGKADTESRKKTVEWLQRYVAAAV